MRFAWFESMAATKHTTMENIRIEYFYALDSLTLLGGVDIVESHLRADIGDVGSNERNHVAMLGELAIRYVEGLTGRHVQSKSANVYIHTLPERLELPFRLDRVNVFSYNSDQHTTKTITVNDAFVTHNATSPSVLEQKLTFQSPTDYALDDPYPYKLECAILGDDDLVSTSTTQTSKLFQGACLLYLAHLYENREAGGVATGRPFVMPLAFESIVKSLRRIR